MNRNTYLAKNAQYRTGLLRKGHPLRNEHRVSMPEHRRVFFDHHGILPPAGWHIHHRNGDPLDNRIENLIALPPGVHIKYHAHLRAREKAAA